MRKNNKARGPARGFGKASKDEVDVMMTQILTMVSLKTMAKKLSELDTTKTAQQWVDWAMTEASQQLDAIESEEELATLVLPMFGESDTIDTDTIVADEDP